MKICTITCHDVSNYGASLQAFALQYYLESLGHEVKIIDYKPNYQNQYKFSTNIDEESPYYDYFIRFPFLKYIKGCLNYLRKYPTRKRTKYFNIFIRKYLHLTQRYTCVEDLRSNPPQADIYIAGSDQIWSTKLPNGKDPAFYMQFGGNHIKRISYAASFGTTPKPEILPLVKELLLGIDKISVRETSGLKILNSMGYSGTHVFDPVFLLSSIEWVKALRFNSRDIKIKGKYILVYDIGIKMPEKEKFTKLLAQQYNCPIVSVNGLKTNSYADVNINNAGPEDFVNLIANAQAIVADSFHATSFSIIFHKPFYTFYKLGNISRMADLLESLGLSERLNPSHLLQNPDWEDVEKKLTINIKRSKQFLLDNIC